MAVLGSIMRAHIGEVIAIKRLTIFLTAVLILSLAGCGTDIPAPPQTSVPPTAATTPLPAPLEETTERASAGFVLEGVDAETVITYFEEVCLNAEFINSGDPSFLQKWTEPICFTIYGTPTPEDLETLRSFTAWLNTVEGFPGISETDDPAEENLAIHFCTEKEMVALMGEQFYGNDGAVTFWYLQDKIYKAVICCRSDIGQQLRNSVILEELYNGLGPIQDTSLRPDSIIWSGYSEPQTLTQMDALILRLLYHPRMECGMDAPSCADVIRELYQ